MALDDVIGVAQNSMSKYTPYQRPMLS